jgi:hypothetical protein
VTVAAGAGGLATGAAQGSSHVRIFAADGFAPNEFLRFDPAFLGGVFVGGPRRVV